jgi:hypothetical protein
MLWLAIAPFFITLGPLLAITFAAVIAGPKFGARRGRVFARSLVGSVLAFVSL